MANNAMHTELAAVPISLYNVTRANRVIASVSRRTRSQANSGSKIVHQTKIIKISTESAGNEGSLDQLAGPAPFSDTLMPLLNEGWRISHVVPIQAGHVLDRTTGLGPSLACYTYTRNLLVFLEKD